MYQYWMSIGHGINFKSVWDSVEKYLTKTNDNSLVYEKVKGKKQ